MNILLIIVYALILIEALFLIFYRFIFLRNPRRKIPAGKNIVSPTDGRIARIIRLKNISHLNIDKGVAGRIKAVSSDVGKDVMLIQIVMNIFNVHYQRAPISGKVKKINYEPGKFENAVRDAGSLRSIRNEKNEILIKGKITVKVIQIAGILARKIVCLVKKGENVSKGEIIGLIKLGSQVALIIPGTISLKVEEGQKVKAGKTVIGVIP